MNRHWIGRKLHTKKKLYSLLSASVNCPGHQLVSREHYQATKEWNGMTEKEKQKKILYIKIQQMECQGAL